MQLAIHRPQSLAAALRHAPRRPAPSPVQERAQRSGGSQDRALYSCGCGFAFKAHVTTTVDCPHCGTTQAW
jgi:hypothetical protein